MAKATPIHERFMAKVRVDEATGCWIWMAFRNPNGYGIFGIGSRTDGSRRSALAHRVAYELYVGPIPKGLTVDHLCHNRDVECSGGPTCIHRRCVNPSHLEPATDQANVLRSPAAVAALNARKTHCKEGHLLTGDNLAIDSHGHRRCRACIRKHGRENMRRYRQQKRRG